MCMGEEAKVRGISLIVCVWVRRGGDSVCMGEEFKVVWGNPGGVSATTSVVWVHQHAVLVAYRYGTQSFTT